MPPTFSRTGFMEVSQCGRSRPTFADDSYLTYLELNSHLAEVQEVIRSGIRRGLIRVVPVPGFPEIVKLIRGRTRG